MMKVFVKMEVVKVNGWVSARENGTGCEHDSAKAEWWR